MLLVQSKRTTRVLRKKNEHPSTFKFFFDNLFLLQIFILESNRMHFYDCKIFYTHMQIYIYIACKKNKSIRMQVKTTMIKNLSFNKI